MFYTLNSIKKTTARSPLHWTMTGWAQPLSWWSG